MKAIPDGYSTLFEVTVTEAMTVDFEQPDPRLGKLHPVYATYWMTKHVELASRLIILPFLEPDEEGIGFEVRVRHLASALPGMKVTVRATLERQEANRFYARCEVHNDLGDAIGEGETTQVVLKRDKLERNFQTLRERFKERA